MTAIISVSGAGRRVGQQQPPVALSFVTRGILDRALVHVMEKAGSALGPDGRTHEEVFGTGATDPRFIETKRKLASWRHAYRFGPIRWVTIWSAGKERRIAVLNLHDRVLLHAVAIAVRDQLPVGPANVMRPGLDSRFSVLRGAVHLACAGPIPHAFRTDLAKAFESIDWRSVLASDIGSRLSDPVVHALAGIHELYSPRRGAPLGLATSSVMLDLACVEVDRKLPQIGELSFRYMDDILVFGRDAGLASGVASLIEHELGRFGLTINQRKTRFHQGEGALDPAQGSHPGYPIEWLGFSIGAKGALDISPEVAVRPHRHLDQVRRHFNLARMGLRYRALFGSDQPQLEQRLWQPPQGGATGGAPSGPLVWKEEVALEGEKFSNSREGSNSSTIASIPTGTIKTHPNHAPEFMGGLPIGPSQPADEDSGGAGRGGRGPYPGLRPPRPDRIDLPEQHLDLLGGLRGLLRLAKTSLGVFEMNGVPMVTGTDVLLGRSLPDAEQLARAHDYWECAKELFWSKGAVLDPAHEDDVLRVVWPVLRTAATVTEVEAYKCCVADPLEELILRLGGKSARECRRAIAEEREARSRRMPPRRLTLWGAANLNSAMIPAAEAALTAIKPSRRLDPYQDPVFVRWIDRRDEEGRRSDREHARQQRGARS